MPTKSEDGVACVQQGSVSAPILVKGGKLLKCFHCGENHRVENCPHIIKAKKKEIMDAKKNHWEERRHSEAVEKANKTTPGQAHMQTAADRLEDDEEIIHQDEDDDLNFAFMQNRQAENSLLKAQRACETLKPSYIYLDSTSSFHQMFREKYMTDVRQVDVALQ